MYSKYDKHKTTHTTQIHRYIHTAHTHTHTHTLHTTYTHTTQIHRYILHTLHTTHNMEYIVCTHSRTNSRYSPFEILNFVASNAGTVTRFWPYSLSQPKVGQSRGLPSVTSPDSTPINSLVGK